MILAKRCFASLLLLLLAAQNQLAWGIVTSYESQGLLRHEQQAALESSTEHAEVDDMMSELNHVEATGRAKFFNHITRHIKNIASKVVGSKSPDKSEETSAGPAPTPWYKKAAARAKKAAAAARAKLGATTMSTTLPITAAEPFKGLVVTVISASNVKDMDAGWGGGESDVYVVVNVLVKHGAKGLKQFKTPTVEDEKHPVWNFEQQCYMWYEALGVQFEMYDEDTLGNDLIGKASIDAKDIVTIEGSKEFNLEIEGATLKVKLQPIPGEEDAIVSTAKMAFAIYYPERTPIGNWDLGDRLLEVGSAGTLLGKTTDKDTIGLYVNRKDGSCAIAFTGTDDLLDMLQDIDIRKAKGCGYELHKGFFGEFSNIVKSEGWKTTIQHNVKKMCRGEIFATGHSLGGAVATILTLCTNDPEPNEFTDYLGFRVNALYTVGAPSVSTNDMWNKTAEKLDLSRKDGQPKDWKKMCYNGMRSYTDGVYDSQLTENIVGQYGIYDPVCYLASRFGFVHPHLRSQRVWGKFNEVKSESYTCEGQEAKDGVKTKGAIPFPDPKAHLAYPYVYRLASVFRGSSSSTSNYHLTHVAWKGHGSDATQAHPAPTPAPPTPRPRITATELPTESPPMMTDLPTATPSIATAEPTSEPVEDEAVASVPTRRPTECWQKPTEK
jgi:hypothetical protein